MSQIYNEDFLNYVEGLTLQDRKNGYGSILHEYMIAMRADMLSQDDLKKIADVVHEMPPFLSGDLRGFSDEMFWSRASKYDATIFGILSNWFEGGVVATAIFEGLMKDIEAKF